jgi:hypothetical protein
MNACNSNIEENTPTCQEKRAILRGRSTFQELQRQLLAGANVSLGDIYEAQEEAARRILAR